MDNQIKGIVEGLLFATGDEGVTIDQLSNVLQLTNINVQNVLDQLKEDYKNDDRGMSLMHANDVYYLTTKKEHSSHLIKLLETPQSSKLSQAALETLAIIAYEQPITRIEVEEVRGVNSERAIRTLMARSLIKEVGRKDTIGRPILFGTTIDFLTYFGLVSLDELPPLPQSIDEQTVETEANLFFDQLNKVSKEE
ncbi:MAG TPA: SMC-Scp complex subunit ScpB [Bacillota bacterium]|nr:SMC-Scp complex subunit ScpB [Bacillota bacterium]